MQIYDQRRKATRQLNNWHKLDFDVKRLIWFLENRNTCTTAINWVIDNSDLSIAEIWSKCQRGDWLATILNELEINSELERYCFIIEDFEDEFFEAMKYMAKTIKNCHSLSSSVYQLRRFTDNQPLDFQIYIDNKKFHTFVVDYNVEGFEYFRVLDTIDKLSMELNSNRPSITPDGVETFESLPKAFKDIILKDLRALNMELEGVDLLIAYDNDDKIPERLDIYDLSYSQYMCRAEMLKKQVPKKYWKLMLKLWDASCCEESVNYVYENYEKGDTWLLNNVDRFSNQPAKDILTLMTIFNYTGFDFQGLINKINRELEAM